MTERIALGENKHLEFIEGDITQQTTDAIVNAANSSLLGGGGVDGAIHRAGGPAILEECRKIRQSQYRQGLPPGKAVATTAGRLPNHYVIHTVGPIWRGGGAGEPGLLASCYQECIRLADELKLATIAFPSISTGAYGYPLEQAAGVALKAISEALRAARHVTTARLVLFGAHDYQVYRKLAGAPEE
jgi:O-acetyl-ADP-ribose deacetylase (regulator of RNase III)